jgi:phosphomannomutase
MGDRLNLSMFRAYDIRTPSALLTPELAERLARAEAAYCREVLGAAAVVVARDARRSGPQHLRIAADAYRDAGLNVIYLPGVTSASCFYFAAMRHPKCAAVMFGASHNPADDTGRKILGPDVTPIAAEIGPQGGLHKIKELYVRGVTAQAQQRGRVRACEVMDEYIDYSMSVAGVAPGGLRGAKVFQDYLHGAAGREMMLAFDRAGAELTPLHFTPDGTFPLGDPNPVKQAVIAEGMAALRAGDYLLGMFFDGDGDRLDVYGGEGQYLSSSFVYAAILPEIRRRFSGLGMGVFADLKCNPLAVIEMAHSGVTIDVIRNGHSQIKQSMIEEPAKFGTVEESAHFYEAFSCEGHGRFCTENTLYIALLLTRIWQEDPERLSRLLAIQETTARAREWGYKFPGDPQRAAALEAVREHFESQGARAMERMKNGRELEATLLRRGLPFDIDQHARLAADWLQVCQRISQSEDGLARWEVVGANAELVRDAKRAIARCVQQFGAGEEYQG